MQKQDIRYKQRFENFRKALAQLRAGVELAKQRELSDLEKQGLIQSFEYTHELAWKVMKDFFEYQGKTDIYGSRDAIRYAFQTGLISYGEDWMEMIKSRNLSSHTYNYEIAEEIIQKIIAVYFDRFKEFEQKMLKLK